MTKNTNNIILLKALYDKNLKLVNKLLLNKSISSNLAYVNLKGENALLLCLHFEYHDLALKILDYDNVGLEQIDHKLNNTLIMAIKKKYEDVALKILNKGFKNINYVDVFGDSALTCAIHYNQKSIIDKLLTYPNLNVNHIDNQGDNALYIAIHNLKEDIALKIIMNYKVDINFTHQKYNTDILTLAINKEMTKLVNYFIKNEPNIKNKSNDIINLSSKKNNISNLKVQEYNINITEEKYLENPLEIAINTNDEKTCINIYNKNKKNAEIITCDNNSILILALTNYMYELSKILIENGSEQILKHINNDKNNALFLCITNGFWDLVEDLIYKKCYDVNSTNISNDCLLIFIINTKNEKLALKIFDDNKDIIDVNIINKQKDSLLLLSIVNEMQELALKIIEKIDIEYINQPNLFNDTVLLLAINLEYWDIVHALIKKNNININHINKHGDNALLLLINLEQWDLVEKILNKPNIDKYYKNNFTALEVLTNLNIVHLLKYF